MLSKKDVRNLVYQTDVTLYKSEHSKIIKNLISVLDKEKPALLGAYVAMGHEVCLNFFLKTYASSAALPICNGHDMSFHRWMHGEKLNTGTFSNLEPLQNSEIVVPEIFIAPTVAINKKNGMRLGRGGGVYDRYFFDLKKKTEKFKIISLAYSYQLCHQWPCERHDRGVDILVTANEVIYFS